MGFFGSTITQSRRGFTLYISQQKQKVEIQPIFFSSLLCFRSFDSLYVKHNIQLANLLASEKNFLKIF